MLVGRGVISPFRVGRRVWLVVLSGSMALIVYFGMFVKKKKRERKKETKKQRKIEKNNFFFFIVSFCHLSFAEKGGKR